MFAIPRAAVVCALALFATAVLAAPAKSVRVAFKPDAHEATVKGQLKGAAVVDYLFAAKTGETISISLKSDQSALGFSLASPIDHQMTFQATEFRGVAPADGDYKVSVLLLRSEAQRNTAAAYTLTIGHETVAPLEPAETPQ